MGNSLRKEEIQVIIEGRPASGKSSALFHLKNDEVLLTPTPGCEGFFVESVSHAGATLTVWELHCPHIKNKCLSRAQALCFVVDCKDDSTGLEQAKVELHETMWKIASQESRRCFTVLVLANKQDLDKAMSPLQLERALGIGDRSDSDTWRWRVQGCSATQGLGLREGMDWLATASRQRNPFQRRDSCRWVETDALPAAVSSSQAPIA